jgi:hypothetical protein
MKYKVQLARTEYLSQEIEVEADSEDEAQDQAWDLSGEWECVSAEEFTNGIECLEEEEIDEEI